MVNPREWDVNAKGNKSSGAGCIVCRSCFSRRSSTLRDWKTQCPFAFVSLFTDVECPPFPWIWSLFRRKPPSLDTQLSQPLASFQSRKHPWIFFPEASLSILKALSWSLLCLGPTQAGGPAFFFIARNLISHTKTVTRDSGFFFFLLGGGPYGIRRKVVIALRKEPAQKSPTSPEVVNKCADVPLRRLFVSKSLLITLSLKQSWKCSTRSFHARRKITITKKEEILVLASVRFRKSIWKGNTNRSRMARPFLPPIGRRKSPWKGLGIRIVARLLLLLQQLLILAHKKKRTPA